MKSVRLPKLSAGGSPRGNVKWEEKSGTSRKPTRRARMSAFTAPIGRGETRDALNLRIVLPAVKPEDLRVAVEAGVLRLSGERHRPSGFAENGRCHFAMPYGAFAQDIPLPDGLDVTRMRTELHEGVLDVHIPFVRAAPQAVSVAARPLRPDIRAEPVAI